MRLRFLLVLSPVILLQGCFFIFIPGSVINAAADSLSGSVGKNCVGASAKVGDRVILPNDGATWHIEKLEGTSYRCTDPNLPIRALLSRD